eukprot:g72297.t1
MKRSREENNDFSSQDKELTKLIESASRSSDSSGSSDDIRSHLIPAMKILQGMLQTACKNQQDEDGINLI